MQFALYSLLTLAAAADYGLELVREGQDNVPIYQDSNGFWTIDASGGQARVHLSGTNLVASDNKYVDIEAQYVRGGKQSPTGDIWKANDGFLEVTSSDQFYLCPENSNRVAWVIHGGQVPFTCRKQERAQVKLTN